MSCAIFLTNDEPVLDGSSDANELLEPPDGLRGGRRLDDKRRDGSALLQLSGTFTAHRL